MRVIFCSEFFWPVIGGAEIFATNLLSALRDRGHEIIVVTRRDSADLLSEDRYRGIPIYRIPFWMSFEKQNVDQLIAARRQLIELKRAFAPDLIHIHGFGPSAVFHLDTMRAHSAPLLVTLIEERTGLGRDLLVHVLRSADWVTGKSSAVLSQARQLAPEITPRSSLIYNGLAVPAVLPEPLPTDPPKLLCLGRLNVQKGFDVAIASLASIVERFPAARLTIAGDGAERPTLERQVVGVGLQGAVDFTGWISPRDVFELINTSTIVIMPSRWEGLPSVVLQAAIMARPVIGARVSGISDVVVHKDTGLLVEPDDSKALAEAAMLLLDDPETAARMGQAARRRVQEMFGWEQCVSAYDSLWRRIVESWRGALRVRASNATINERIPS